MNRSVWILACCAVLAGCGRGDSGLNPLHWFGRGAPKGPQTLAPEGGYVASADARLPIPQVLSAHWEQTTEGRLLVVTGIAPTKGWWDAAIITQTPQPPGRIRPDPDGVLRLRLVGLPPRTGSAVAAMPARPDTDTLTVAFPISRAALERIDAVAVTAGNNTVSLKV